MKEDERERLIDDLIGGDISEADFLRLEAEMIVSEEVRQEYYDRQKLDTALRLDAESRSGAEVPAPAVAGGLSGRRWKIDWLMVCGLAALVLVVGAIGWRIGQDSESARSQGEEPVATGFGVVSAESDAVWANRSPLSKGDLLPAGTLNLKSGIAQLELFSGVVLLIEGEAEFEVISSMELLVARGKLRAQVPELARGFRIRTAAGDVVDRGTEFALEVTPDYTDLHVVEGSIEWRPHSATLRKLAQGESIRWDIKAGQEATGITFDRESLSRLGAFEQKLTDQQADRLENWQEHGRQLRSDSRLLAYFPMDRKGDGERQLIDESGSGIDGTVVRADRAMDRWGRPYGGLDFSPMGSRIRLTIPGEHRSITLMCWVKIDSLDRWYNSLFLTDGHELNEPHWQIMDDGRLFFSVKAHDGVKKDEDKHIAYSPPIWTPAQSGQWMHLATVYDGDAATTTHYVNGEAISIDQIPEDMQIDKVRIGPASIGNWSEPKRDDADFAVRNLNGTIDEFALFSAHLSAAEVREMFEIGKP